MAARKYTSPYIYGVLRKVSHLSQMSHDLSDLQKYRVYRTSFWGINDSNDSTSPRLRPPPPKRGRAIVLLQSQQRNMWQVWHVSYFLGRFAGRRRGDRRRPEAAPEPRQPLRSSRGRRPTRERAATVPSQYEVGEPVLVTPERPWVSCAGCHRAGPAASIARAVQGCQAVGQKSFGSKSSTGNQWQEFAANAKSASPAPGQVPDTARCPARHAHRNADSAGHVSSIPR